MSFNNLLRAFLSRLSLTKKIIILYMTVVLLPGCVFMYFYYQKSSAIIEQDMGKTMLQTLKQAEINITYRLNNIQNMSNSLIANPDLYRYITGADQSPSEQFQSFRELEKLVQSSESNRDIHRIRLFVEPELSFSREQLHFFPLTDIRKDKQWFERTLDKNGSFYWRGTVFERFIGGEDAYVLSSSRMLRDPGNFEKLAGIIVIDVKEERIQSILDEVTLARSQNVYMLNEDGTVVSHSDPGMLGKPMPLSDHYRKTFNGQTEGFFRNPDRPDIYTIFHRVPMTGWTIVAEIPHGEISGESVTLTKISGVIVLAASFVVFILVLSLVFAYVAESLSRRLKQMIRMMKKEGLEGLDTGLPQQGGDLRKLEASIAGMVQTVKHLAEESYQAKLHEREAQLKALQAQINPHFLYNTLDSMNWMAIRRQAGDISGMIESLSQYFRLSLSKGKDVVTLREELQLIRSYMHIQNIRFSDGIQMDYRISEQALACKLPKLTLQPLVENAVLHGILQKKPKTGTIRITGYLEGDCLSIAVEDNGVGIQPERLKQLLQPPQPGHEFNSFGLFNVHERVRLYSQTSGCGLVISSEPGRGTRVTVLVKVT